uniref:Uncharacterized protein n=1 Tax=Zea mays TaxID=4577 RepID=C4J8D2_MAIZE|nr:unknown [Zea mays]
MNNKFLEIWTPSNHTKHPGSKVLTYYCPTKFQN